MTKEAAKQLYLDVSKLLGKAQLTRKEFCRESGVAKNQIVRLFGSYGGFRNECTGGVEEKNWGQELDFDGDLTYNKDNDCYIIYLKCLSKHVVLKGQTIRDIQRNYSDLLGEPATLVEISRDHGIPRYVLTEILKKLEINHSELPLTKEELQNKDTNEITDDLLELKKFKVVQDFNRRDWQNTIRDAKKWQEFESQKFNPFAQFIEGWQPPQYNPVKFDGKAGEKVWLAGLSDIHVGLIANERYNFFKGGWEHKDLENAVKEYANKIRVEVNNRKTGFNEAYLIILGDICHGLFGFTDKGTKLEAGPLAEEQFDLAFNISVYFINELLSIFPKLSVKALEGNHSSFGDYAVAMALKCYYRQESRINFEITTKRYLPFKIGDYLFIAEHGYSAWFKARLPKAGLPRENYMNGLLLTNPKLLQDVKQHYLITADQHHFEAREYSHFEHFMFSSLIGGDRHSDNCGYNNRPRQNCLVVDEDGVKEIVSIYFN
jgi:hypothetical protein